MGKKKVKYLLETTSSGTAGLYWLKILLLSNIEEKNTYSKLFPPAATKVLKDIGNPKFFKDYKNTKSMHTVLIETSRK